MEDTVPGNQYFEEYLKPTGWGLYNTFVVGLACACNFIQAVTFVTIPLSLALSSCTTNFIPEHVTLRVFTSFYLGSCFGGLVGNFLSDRYGRKRYLSYSLMFIFLSTFTAAFAHNAYVIIGASLFLGVGLETNIVSMKLLLIEILPKERRGAYMVFSHIFWALGYVATTILTIHFETPAFSTTSRTPDVNLTTWRVMFAVCGGANILLACACALIEESPRYFLHMGRSYLAYLVLKQLYAINNSSFAENFKVKEEDVKNLIPQYDLLYMEPEQYWDIFKKLNWRFYRSMKIMFSKRFWRTTCVLILLKTPLLVVRPLAYMSREEREKSTSMCAFNADNIIFYRYFLLLASAMIPGLITSMVVVDRLGRKRVLFAGFLLSGCSFLLLRFIKGMVFQVVASCIILTLISSVISVLSLLNLEAYPTAIRGTSCGVTNFLGLFLSLIFMNIVVIESKCFIVVMGILCLCLSISTLLLPELRKKPMTE